MARSNRLPDSLPVVLKLLEGRTEGMTIPDLLDEVERQGLWDREGGPRAKYFRMYSILKLLHRKGIVVRTAKDGREALWTLDPQAFAQQRRRELSEIIQPFVDGCLMVTDPEQFVSQLGEMVADGTMEAMLAERRSQVRGRP
jgi:hypothetical protein